MPPARSHGRVLCELSSEEWLVSHVICVKERMCVDDITVFDRDGRMLFVKSKYIGGRVSPIHDEYDVTLNVLRAWRAEESALPEQRTA